ncbi:MAG: right-handed parallel beta-helix repeat-containing protein [Sandaracinaceae bacterium]|nr:right-handed parallel beta-helix repeat-containing protein [Sandaracinaceae bacterium]
MPRAKRSERAPTEVSEAQWMVLGVAAPLVAMNDLPPARFGGYRVGEPSATHQMAGLSMLPRAEGRQRIEKMLARGGADEPAWCLGRAAAWASFAYAARLFEAPDAWGYMVRAARSVQAAYAGWEDFAAAYAASRVAFRGKTGEPKGYETKLFAKLLRDPESPWVRARFGVSLADDLPPPVEAPRTLRVRGSAALHAALAAAQPGDHLLLAAGEYAGPFELGADITLTAARVSAAVLSGPVVVDDAGVLLDGVVLRGGGLVARGEAVVHLRRCRVDGGRVGIIVSGKDTHLFATDVRVESPDEYGVIVDRSAYAELERVRVRGGKNSAVSVEAKAKVRLRDVDLGGAGEAGLQVHSATATLEGGLIARTGYSALLVRAKARVSVTGARFERSAQSLVAVRDGSDVVLEDCMLRRAKVAGIDVGGSGSRVVARRCRVEEVHSSGVVVAAGSASLHECVFAGARYDAITVREGGAVTVWRGELRDARGAGLSVEVASTATLTHTAILEVNTGVRIEANTRVGLDHVRVSARDTSITMRAGSLALLDCTLEGGARAQLEVEGGRVSALRMCSLDVVDIGVATAGDARVALHECHLSGGELLVLAEGESLVRAVQTQLLGSSLAAVSAQPGEVHLERCVVRGSGNGVEAVGGRLVLADTVVEVADAAISASDAGVVEAHGGRYFGESGPTFEADSGATVRVERAQVRGGEQGLVSGDVVLTGCHEGRSDVHEGEPCSMPPPALPFTMTLWEDNFCALVSDLSELLAPCAAVLSEYEEPNGHGVGWLVDRIAAAASLMGVDTDPEADGCTIYATDYAALRQVLETLALMLADPARITALAASHP